MVRLSGWRWIGLLVGLSAAGCVPVTSTPLPVTLPAPQVYITRVVTETPAPVKSTGTPVPTRGAAMQGSLLEMARAVYGDRLIAEIQIPGIRVDAPVVPVGWEQADVTGENLEWESPDASVGWAVSSGLPGDAGNVILYGHNNLHSNVFMHLDQLKAGDEIKIRTGEGMYLYRVETVEIIPVTDPQADAAAVEKYFQADGEARLTLLSCWPPVSNTHRVIVISLPAP